jgi:segregation and condensation protein B
MSLKAKLEAVIYAAEEPVTLAQLASLFVADALEWKALQEAASADEADDEEAQPLPMANGEFAYLDPAPVPEPIPEPALADSLPLELEGVPAEPDAEAAVEASPAVEPYFAAEASSEAEVNPATEVSSEGSSAAAASSEANSEAGPAGVAAVLPTAGEESGEGSPTAAAEAVANAESEARRLARLRDREVRAILRQLLDELIASCAADGRGVEIREIAGGYRMATKPECHDAVRLFVKSLKPALKLSLPALETLAVIAYKQPVTAPEVNEIRGVDSSGVFGSLLARKLISTAGRKPVIGRPILYKTTREFLLRFGLKDVSELPSIEEFEKMAASELDEPESREEPAQEPPNPAAGPEFDETASEELEDSTVDGLESQTETTEPTETAETAVSNEPTNPAEAAPAAPPPTEQEETETFPNEE